MSRCCAISTPAFCSTSVRWKIREAPATTLHDCLALFDVNLAADIAFYGARDYPMIMRLLRAMARTVPGFEFNSLRRSLSSPGQFDQ